MRQVRERAFRDMIRIKKNARHLIGKGYYHPEDLAAIYEKMKSSDMTHLREIIFETSNEIEDEQAIKVLGEEYFA